MGDAEVETLFDELLLDIEILHHVVSFAQSMIAIASTSTR